MGLFITSTTLAKRHGVYAIERTPPATVRATGSSTSALIGQFPWGPSQTLFTPTDMNNLLSTFAPAGMTRTGSGYLSIIRKGWPLLKVVRVEGATAVIASAILNKTGPTPMLTLTLKYPGTAGNSVTATVAAPSDGNVNHFNLTISVTGQTGTTTDFFQNLDYSGTATDSTPDFTKTLLIGSITKTASGVPLNGTTTFSSGTDGTIASGDYVGTQGAADKGVAKLEGDRTIDHLFADDPGNSLRSAVNAGLQAHADYMSDRVAYINGPTGQTQSVAQTDVANYRSLRVVYADPWVYINNDVDGTKTLVPSACFAASVAAQLAPSTSIAWKSTEVQTMLQGIVDLEFDRGEAASLNTDAGICTFIREVNGGYTIEAGVNTDNPVAPSKGTLTRTRMGHYIARSITTSLRTSVDSPNVPLNQQDEITAVEDFMAGLKAAKNTDPNHLPHVLDYFMNDVNAANSFSDLQAGNFTIPLDVTISASQAKIFLSLNYGETVKVSVQL